jgi:hypothetical protein
VITVGRFKFFSKKKMISIQIAVDDDSSRPSELIGWLSYPLGTAGRLFGLAEIDLGVS